MIYFILVAIILLIILIIYLFTYKDKKEEKNYKLYDYRDEEIFKLNSHTINEKKKKYQIKPLLSKCEIRYFEIINYILKECNQKYYLEKQVNLASIIEKKEKYANELFRNIDFGIFDRNFNVICLIEINDKTHNDNKRMARDYKIKDILQEVNIPLITLWTRYDINPDYIRKRILEYCN